ncbi:thiamine pyrophosphokinase [Lichenicola sp.]|uniref:NUDIX hydrolase n=1 Tax=Lichenicola sp. TaxID=2804529 RepID=UPI003AFFF2A9
MTPSIAPFLRHLDACNNADLPGGRLPFLLGSAQVGWIAPGLAPELERRGVRREGDRLILDDGRRLLSLGQEMASDGLFRDRHEPFDVRAEPDGAVLAQLDRGALPSFGVLADGVHVNGIVERADGTHLWVGRRAPDKLLDPDKLDHLIGGGVSAGYDSRRTLAKEGAEECSLPAELAGQAVLVATIRYAMARPEGLRRDRLLCFDLVLPESFQPVPADGEVVSFTLLPLAEVFRLVRDTDAFKFNVNLVLIDLFLRHGLIDPATSDGELLRHYLNGSSLGSATR